MCSTLTDGDRVGCGTDKDGSINCYCNHDRYF